MWFFIFFFWSCCLEIFVFWVLYLLIRIFVVVTVSGFGLWEGFIYGTFWDLCFGLVNGLGYLVGDSFRVRLYFGRVGGW